MKEIIGYIRVSTTKQVGKNKNGLDAQLSDINYWLEGHGIDIDDVEIICDSAKSASSVDKRTGFQTIVERVKKKQVKMVIAQCSDRLFRNVMDTVTLGELFKQNKINVQLVKGEFDYSTSNGKFNTNIKACVDQNWIDKTREDTFDRMKAAAYKGHYIFGGKCPIGYYRKEKKLVIKEDEKNLIIQIYELLSSNQYTLYSLANYLNSRQALGIKWTDRKLEHILSNKIYYGCLDTTKAAHIKCNGFPMVVIENHTPAIISQELWEQANIAMIKKTGLHKYLFKNLVKCKGCGAWCTHSSTIKPRKVYLYYCCEICKKRINESVIYEKSFSYLQEVYEQRQNNNGKQILERRIQKHAHMLKSLDNNYLDDIIDEQYFNSKKEELLVELKKLSNEQMYLSKMKVKKFSKLDKILQREIVRSSVKSIQVNFDTKDVYIEKMKK